MSVLHLGGGTTLGESGYPPTLRLVLVNNVCDLWEQDAPPPSQTKKKIVNFLNEPLVVHMTVSELL